MIRCALFGNPVTHSLSPLIHSLFGKQTGYEVHYETVTAQADNFFLLVKEFAERGGVGVNVTAPLKQAALHICSSLSDHAKTAGSVNTLLIQDFNNYWGDNTDGRGFLADVVTRQGISLAGKKVLMLGAGGAARGILSSLLVHQPSSVIVANRDKSKADHFQQKWPSIVSCDHTTIPQEPFDLVIDARSISANDELLGPSKIALAQDSVAYSTNYGTRAKPFLTWADELGFKYKSDGLGMLVAQAAYSFSVWTGVFPDWEKILNSPLLESVNLEMNK